MVTSRQLQNALLPFKQPAVTYTPFDAQIDVWSEIQYNCGSDINWPKERDENDLKLTVDHTRWDVKTHLEYSPNGYTEVTKVIVTKSK